MEYPGLISICVYACRLVVVLERRTLVHDLKTLELLRTIETPPNPKVAAFLVTSFVLCCLSEAMCTNWYALHPWQSASHIGIVCQNSSAVIQLKLQCKTDISQRKVGSLIPTCRVNSNFQVNADNALFGTGFKSSTDCPDHAGVPLSRTNMWLQC